MSSSTGGNKDEAGTKNLETFPGENSGEYLRWRRGAELYLLGLPTHVPEKKWGARLIEHLTGEAEEVVAFMSIEDITKTMGGS